VGDNRITACGDLSPSPSEPPSRSGVAVTNKGWPLRALLGTGSVMASALMLGIQPSVGLALLPATGSNPTLWVALQGVFQMLLVAGYLACFPGRGGIETIARRTLVIAVLGTVVSAALALMPMRLDSGSSVFVTTIKVIALLGLPFVALATVSPMVQLLWLRWTGRDPIWVYAMGNVGSVLAIACYPIWIEPSFDVDVQLRLAALAAFGVLTAFSLVLATQRRTLNSFDADDNPSTQSVHAADIARWIAGGAVSVLVSLSATALLVVDRGSTPWVWCAPFACYLVASIAVFTESLRQRLSSVVRLLCPGTVFLAMADALGLLQDIQGAHIEMHLVAVFTLTFRVHEWLKKRRPAQRRQLPGFYAAIASGGALAGFGTAFLTPSLLSAHLLLPVDSTTARLAFRSIVPEYTIGLLIGVAVTYLPVTRPLIKRGVESIIAGIAFSLLLFSRAGLADTVGDSASLVISAIAATTVGVFARPVVLALVSFAITGALLVPEAGTIAEDRRSAFARIRVIDEASRRVLFSGTTVHGFQPLTCFGQSSPDPVCGEPTSYYHRTGPLGRTVDRLRESRQSLSIAVVGLGAGSIAGYCSRPDVLHFVEIDPVVVTIARTAFRFLELAQSNCGSLEITEGDGRLALRKAQTHSVDLLVMDAFGSDSIPAHLLTVEAIREYQRLLKPSGIMAFHISHRILDLRPVIEGAAEEAGLRTIHLSGPAGLQGQRSSSRWSLVSADEKLVAMLQKPLDGNAGDTSTSSTVRSTVKWTDQRHSLASLPRRQDH
jgi:hypothetical protein